LVFAAFGYFIEISPLPNLIRIIILILFGKLFNYYPFSKEGIS